MNVAPPASSDLERLSHPAHMARRASANHNRVASLPATSFSEPFRCDCGSLQYHRFPLDTHGLVFTASDGEVDVNAMSFVMAPDDRATRSIRWPAQNFTDFSGTSPLHFVTSAGPSGRCVVRQINVNLDRYLASASPPRCATAVSCSALIAGIGACIMVVTRSREPLARLAGELVSEDLRRLWAYAGIVRCYPDGRITRPNSLQLCAGII